jgi:hypothetical protein
MAVVGTSICMFCQEFNPGLAFQHLAGHCTDRATAVHQHVQMCTQFRIKSSWIKARTSAQLAGEAHHIRADS